MNTTGICKLHEFTASILAANPLRLFDNLTILQEIGVKSLHIDIMDGHYVNNLALSYETLNAISQAFPKFNLDIHLMVKNVEQSLNHLTSIKPRMITFHPSTCKNPAAIIHLIQQHCQASIAINPTEKVENYLELFNKAKHCLVMGVHPGKCGQPFQKKALETIVTLHQFTQKTNLNAQIAIDGGVNTSSLLAIQKTGVPITQKVVGSALFKKLHYQENWKALHACAQNMT